MLAKHFEREGWSVWWDPEVPPGKTFDEVIDEALKAAKCVVVLWSKKSASSEWVRTEASEGRRRGILIPALIEDDVEIPLAFRLIHASRLMDWQGQPEHLEFEELKSAITGLLGHPSRSEAHKGVTETTRGKESKASTTKALQHTPRADVPDGIYGNASTNGNGKTRRGKLLKLVGLLALLVAIAAVAFWILPRTQKPAPLTLDEGPVYGDPATNLVWTREDNDNNVDWTSQTNTVRIFEFEWLLGLAAADDR